MAYAAAISVTQYASGVPAEDELGPVYQVTITETEAAAASEAEIVLADEGLPTVGRIIHRGCKLTSGTGTTVSPVSGELTDPANAAFYRFQFGGTAAALVNEQPTKPLAYVGSSLFHRSGVNAGTDNSITTVYLIVAGVGLV